VLWHVLLIILCIALSIHLVENIIHYSVGVQIPLCIHFGLQFEVIYFLNSRSSFYHGHKLQVLLLNYLTWSKFKYHGHRKLQVIASKNVLFIKMREFHSLIFESVLDFCLETSYSFLIFVFNILKKCSVYRTHQNK
jgi:hypothetical protein